MNPFEETCALSYVVAARRDPEEVVLERWAPASDSEASVEEVLSPDPAGAWDP